MRSKCFAVALLSAVSLGSSPSSLRADDAKPTAAQSPRVIRSEKVDVSPALRTMSNRPTKDRPENYRPTSSASRENPKMPRALRAQDRGSIDSVVQRSIQGVTAMPAPSITFPGVGNKDNASLSGFTVYPPDTVGDVGPNHYVQAVNLAYAVYGKNGVIAPGFPKQTNLLWQGFGGPCENTNDGDPIVLYDELADRWMISQFTANVGAPPTYQCIAISTSGDPTGSYYRYGFAYPDVFNDYPHFGVWSDGYYMTAHQFDYAFTQYLGQGVMAFERDKMLAGQPANLIYFNLNDIDPNLGGFLPSDADGLRTPPVGTPNYFAHFTADEYGDPRDGMKIWGFSADWDNPINSTFTVVADLAVAAFNPNVPTNSGMRNVPQPNPAAAANDLDALQDRLMNRLAYRNLATYEAMVVTHTVDAIPTGQYQAAPRWYELRRTLPSGTWAVQNQSTFAPDATHRWMGSAALDNNGNMAIGYSASSNSVMPAIRYAGRLLNDPANQLAQGEAVMQAGLGVQLGTGSRWGDYSSLNVDPTDGCTFWYTTEYYTGSNEPCPTTASTICWSTRIGSFRFPSCINEPRGSLSGTVTNSGTGLPIQGAIVASTTGYSRSTDGSGAYSMVMGPGTYDVSASAFGYTPSASTPVTVTDGTASTRNFALSGIPILAYDSSSFSDGNGNGRIDPNECIRLTVALDNLGAGSANSIASTLTTATAGVTITNASSAYNNIAPGGTGSNLTMFDIETAPGFVCGTRVEFTLDVTAGATPFVVPFTLASGTAGSTTSVSNNTALVIPDLTTVESAIAMSGVAGIVADVTVSLFITHTYVSDLSISLVSPDGTEVGLSAGHGADTDDYGSACTPVSNRTTFDDSAATAIGAAAAPRVGTFRPDQPLAGFRGIPANGTWRLRITDSFAVDTGLLNCWTLNVKPYVCTDGGGGTPAAPSISGTATACPGTPINLTANSGFGSYQWYFDGNLITGATSQTYSVASATSANAGNYTVTGTTNACGLTSPQSPPFPVSVTPPPAAPAVTGTSAACNGTSFNLSANAGYSSYQWYLGGNLIVGATSQTYSVASAAPANAGNYTVTGTSACGLTSTQSATFAVAVPSCLITPTALAVDGNGVMEAGETAGLTPSWDNDGDVTLSIVGTLSSFAGPGTSTYTISDGAGGYGSVTAGGTAAATNNYGLTVSVPAARPLVHWDASVIETPGTTPNSVNAAKTWSLHMGNSFTDVAITYLFYRHIETLLHNSVTLGCGDGTQFCKNDPTSRIAMAVFIARSELGSDAAVPDSGMVGASSYNCTAGGNSLFTDVLPNNQFCKHVHYIASQNITQGCTGTTYCPTQNVSRIQMAIFLARARAGSDAAVPTAYSNPANGRSYDLPNNSRAFTDLVGSNFERHANYLWALGISDGCTATTYCPSNLLTRGQMAKFLVGTYDLLLYKP